MIYFNCQECCEQRQLEECVVHFTAILKPFRVFRSAVTSFIAHIRNKNNSTAFSEKRSVRFLEFIRGLCTGFYINFLLGWAVNWLWNFSFIFQVAGSDEDKRQEQRKGFPSQYYLEVSELCLVLFLCSHCSHHPEFIVIWLLSKTCSEDQTLKPS